MNAMSRARYYPSRSVTKVRKPTGHVFHLLMMICTCGLWTPMWASMTAWHKLGPRKRLVTRHR